MKRLLILFVMLFCLVSCNTEIKTDYMIINQLEKELTGRVRYRCEVRSTCGDVAYFYFRTNEPVYTVGDTLYLTKRKY